MTAEWGEPSAFIDGVEVAGTKLGDGSDGGASAVRAAVAELAPQHVEQLDEVTALLRGGGSIL